MKPQTVTELNVDSGLNLRLMEDADAPELFRLVDRNREVLRRWLSWLDFDRSVADQQRVIASFRRKFFDGGVLNTCIWKDGRIAGTIGFNQIDWVHRSASIGYWLGSEFTRQGIMVRCCERLITHGFTDLHLHRIEVRCGTENYASRRIPERLNLRLEGCLREAESLYGRYVSLNVYSVLEHEWKPKR